MCPLPTGAATSGFSHGCRSRLLVLDGPVFRCLEDMVAGDLAGTPSLTSSEVTKSGGIAIGRLTVDLELTRCCHKPESVSVPMLVEVEKHVSEKWRHLFHSPLFSNIQRNSV